MHPEIEAKFIAIDEQDVRQHLTENKADLITPMRTMKRVVLDFPNHRLQKQDGWVRIRDEGDKVTLAYKEAVEQQMGYNKEVEVVVDDFNNTIELFKKLGLKINSVQESRRETWQLGNVSVFIDEWPWLKPYLEIEGPTEAAVRDVAARLGFPWSQAIFGSVELAYAAEYPGIQLQAENVSAMPEMLFGQPLPKWLKDRQK